MLNATPDISDSIFEAASVGIIVLGPDGKIARLNPALAAMFGYEPNELLGAPLEVLLPEELRTAHIAHRRAFMAAPRSRSMGGGLDLVGRRKNGEVFPIEASLSTVQIGDEMASVAFVADVSERKRLERERDRLLEQERQSRAAAEAAKGRADFLAEARRVLAASLDYKTTLRRLVELMVPFLGDGCAIDLLVDGRLERVVSHHHLPAKAALMEEAQRRFPTAPDMPRMVWAAMETGRSVLHARITPERLAQASTEPGQLALYQQLGLRSAMSVPLSLRGRQLGVIWLIRTEGERDYGSDDLSLAEELALSAAQAIENARLFRAAEEAARRADEARALVDGLMRSAPVGVGFLDRELRYQLVNTHLASFTGLPLEAHIGRTPAEVVPALAAIVEPRYRHVLATGEPSINVEVTGEVPATPGVQRSWLASFFPVREGGAIIGVGVTVLEISDRKRAAEDQARLAAIVDSTDEAIIGQTLDGMIFSWNAAAERLYGYSAAEMVGRNITTLLPPERADELAEIHKRIARGERITHIQTLRLRKDGQPLPVSLTVSPIVGADGRVSGISAIARDISGELRADEERRRQGALARLLQVVAVAANQASTPRAALQTAVDQICATIGWPVGHVYLAVDGAPSSLSTTDIWHLADPERFATFRAISEALEPGLEDLPGLVLISGQPEWVQDLGALRGAARFGLISELGLRSGFALPVLVGAEVAAVLEFFAPTPQAPDLALLEIAGHVGAQLSRVIERARAEAALRASEGLYRTLASNLPNGSVLLFDHNLRYTIADGQALKRAGLSRETVEGRTLHEVLSPERAAALEPYYRDALAGIATANEWATTERTYLVHFLPVRDEAGTIFAGMVMSWDITALKRAEQALLEERAMLARRIEERTADLSAANAELANAARLKDEFLASMSHELRTPLNAILGLGEALREQVYGALGDRQDRVVGMIEESARHLLDLINDILDLAKIGAGKIALEIEEVALEQICEASVRLVREAALKKGISLQLDLDPRAQIIMADPRRLKQILVNLLSNAVKFTPPSGSVGLKVAADADEGQIAFTVWDTGIGIEPEQLGHLFQPFVQLDSRLARNYTGTGLGLALVYGMCELSGGSVRVVSTPGEGSQFVVTLPWRPATRDTRADEAAPAAGVMPPLSHALIVEDSPTATSQLLRYLAELNIQTTTLAEGRQALATAVATQPDLIVLDVLLPDIQGWEVLAQLKGDPRTSAIPVVIISVVDDEARGLALGAAAYVVKPYGRADIARALQQLVPGPAAPQAPPRVRPEATGLILVAEDNEANIMTTVDYLSAIGYRAIVARDGAETIARALELRPDLILMDIQMPEIDGLEATRRLRADPSMAGTPIIAVTALAMPGDRERCIAAGADDYLSKPVGLKRLATVIAEHLARRRAD